MSQRVEPVDAIDYLRDAEPAPGRLALVERFVNTVDHEHGREMLSAPERLRGVARASTGSIRRRRADLRRALEVREALRSLALANNGGARDAAASLRARGGGRARRLVVRFDERRRASRAGGAATSTARSPISSASSTPPWPTAPGRA